MTRMFVATTNAGKLRDFAAALTLPADGEGIELLPLPGLKEIAAPAEDEETFAGNARVKALYYSRFAPGELVLADDSGLEVDALKGAPGVRSARYAEDSSFAGESQMSTDERNNACLFDALNGVAEDKRGARYRCALVAVRDGAVVAEGDGTVEGLIVLNARGDGGFGYDPYFVPEGESGTMAELELEARMKLSHRGRALKDLLEKI